MTREQIEAAKALCAAVHAPIRAAEIECALVRGRAAHEIADIRADAERRCSELMARAYEEANAIGRAAAEGRG